MFYNVYISPKPNSSTNKNSIQTTIYAESIFGGRRVIKRNSENNYNIHGKIITIKTLLSRIDTLTYLVT